MTQKELFLKGKGLAMGFRPGTGGRSRNGRPDHDPKGGADFPATTPKTPRDPGADAPPGALGRRRRRRPKTPGGNGGPQGVGRTQLTAREGQETTARGIFRGWEETTK